jgi:hypothetical protein
MNIALTYSVTAVLIILVVALLLRPSREGAAADTDISGEHVRGLWDAPGLILAERILDPADYLWLREELGFPELGRALRRSRQQMALKWLKAVRRSFHELVRTPEPSLPHSATGDTRASWELLRLTLRFHLVLGYAFLVVRFFGPYHRLVPSFGWMHSISPRAERSGPAEIARFP